MSFFPTNPLNFKSAVDDRSSSVSALPIEFTTSAVRRNVALEKGLLGRQIRVVNDDATNNCVLRLHSRHGVARTIPPSSDLTVKEWFSEFHVEPNGTTGDGMVELDLVSPKDAKK